MRLVDDDSVELHCWPSSSAERFVTREVDVDASAARGPVPGRAERRGSDDERACPVSRHCEGHVALAAADVVGEQASAVATKLASDTSRGLHLILSEHDGTESPARNVMSHHRREHGAGAVDETVRVGRG